MSLGRRWFVSLAAAVTMTGLLPVIARTAETPTEVDPKMRRELEMAEAQLGQAIEKRDTAALANILADYFAASVGDEEKAASKSLVIRQAKAGKLVFYRIEKEPKLRLSAETYDLEGEAKAPRREIADKPVETKWVHVRRVWIKKDGRWLLILQHVSLAAREEKETDRKEK